MPNTKREARPGGADELGAIVQRLVQQMNRFERDHIRVHGFTSSPCYLLLALAASRDMHMKQLAEKLNLRVSTVTRLVDKLVRDGFVERRRPDDDRRTVTLRLTASGGRAADTLRASIDAYYRATVRHLPPQRLDEVLQAANLLLQAFQAANPRCC